MENLETIETIKRAIGSEPLPDMLKISWQVEREIKAYFGNVFPRTNDLNDQNIENFNFEEWKTECSMYARPSGVVWKIAVDDEDRTLSLSDWSEAIALDALYAVHHFAISFRGPILFHGRQLALRDVHPNSITMLDAPDSIKFSNVAYRLAKKHELYSMDSFIAHKWIIPENQLSEEMKFRLDFTDNPSVFQLLIQETLG